MSKVLICYLLTLVASYTIADTTQIRSDLR